MAKLPAYRESQIGWIFLGMTAPVFILMVLAYAYQWGANPIGHVGFMCMMVLLIALSLLFYRLDTTVTYRKIELRYGIGLLRIRPKIDELIAVDTDRAKWWYGLGIRITPRGMMYSIHGLKVVRLTYRKGKTTNTIMIGSAHPEQLLSSLMENFELS